MMARHILGIDLGTTHSLAAVMDGARPRVLPNALGEVLTPSAVFLDQEGHLWVGAAARARGVREPERTALGFKRDMGTDRRYSLGDRSFTPVELSAMVLKQVKEDAEAASGLRFEEAVITVPAYFGELQRRATKDAGEIAGLRVERIINEPTAAALAYGLQDTARKTRVAVLDLGGGTFDVTILEIAERLDQRVRETWHRSAAGHPVGWARLLEACEDAKRRLSEETEVRLALPALPTEAGEIDLELELDREDAERAWAPLLNRLSIPVQRALSDARLRPTDIQEVLLVGGATRMPCVFRLAAKLFGRLPLRTLPPDEAVALGAAVQGALKGGHEGVADMVVTDVAPFSLGVACSDFLGKRRIDGLFCPIIERGTVIPVSRVQRFATTADQQSAIEIEVFQGEHSHTSENTKLGAYTIDDLPKKSANEVRVDVRFTYDLSGLLDVDMTIVETGEISSFFIERSPGSLSPNQIERARQMMQSLKFHPREALPNTTALARAETLYVELSGQTRADLGHAIAMLAAALDGQDDNEIEMCRDALNQVIERLRHRPR
jgi:molecular chaperone HscC